MNDYEIGKRRGLEIINIMNKDATLNAAAGKYAGMDRFKARKVRGVDILFERKRRASDPTEGCVRGFRGSRG